jgi:GxxExxY protein
MEKIVYKDLSFKINGLLFKVHRELGHFRNEKQYGDLLEEFLKKENVRYIREYRFEDCHNGKGIVRCVCDFIIDDKIIIELKAKNFVTKDDYYQVKRYLVTLNLELAIIANFRQYTLYPKRVLNVKILKK